MVNSEELRSILETEYGITTAQDLEKAIANLLPLDITPFVGDIQKKRRYGNDNTKKRTVLHESE